MQTAVTGRPPATWWEFWSEVARRAVALAAAAFALAAGLELVLCCDLVVAVSSAAFGDVHANYGMFPAGGSTVRPSRRIGAARAKHLMFTGVTCPRASWRAPTDHLPGRGGRAGGHHHGHTIALMGA